MLRTALEGEGELIRWCIGRIDEESQLAIAEVVLWDKRGEA